MKNKRDKNDVSYIVPSVDRVFKLIFAAEGNEGLLKDFLESILEIKIDSLEVGYIQEIEFHIIELQKFRESAKIKKNVRDFWLAFLDYTNVELVDMACSENNQIKTAQKELEKIRADEKEREIIFKELMESMDALERESIIKESERQMEENEKQKQENEMQKQENEMQKQENEMQKQENEMQRKANAEKEKANAKKEKELENGKKKLESEKENLINSKKQLLLNLLKANMTVEQIAEMTGLPKQEIAKLTSEK